MMQSSGGILDIASIMQRPAQIVESGPAAGVIGAAHIGRLAGYRNIITLDMGGTTAKASLIENGEVVRTNEYEVGGGISLSSRLAKGGGYALKLPVIDVSEVGAGGGSIVWIDQAGSIKVGPRSAGAVPGPVCYGAGGTEPTVTDANVLLGYLNSTGLAGGSVPIDVGKAQSVLDRDIARPLNQNVKDAAFGIHRLATTVMMRAVKAVSTYRGRDPREFTLFAFGGNGGVHAVELARQLHMRRVVVPLVAGAFSALGLLLANMELTLSRAFLRPLSGASGEEITAAFHDLEKRVLAEFGQRNEPVRLSWHADMRYSGQAFELRIPVEREALTPKHLRIIAARFEQEHQTTYGHRQSGEVVTELVTLRVTGAVELDRRGDFAGKNLLRAGAQGQAETRRLVYFGPHVGDLETPVIDRRSLGNEPQRGPIIVEEYESTIVIPPDATACLDDFGNVVVDIE